MQSRTATKRHGVARKRSTKRWKHTGSLFRKNLKLKDVCWFYTSNSLDHMSKESIRKRIPESIYARIETVDIYTLVKSMNGDRKIEQSIRKNE